MNPADTTLRCHHCDAVPTLKEMADGWCDSCGKKLPESCAAEAKRQRERAAVSAPAARSRPRILWGVVVVVVAAVAAVAIAV